MGPIRGPGVTLREEDIQVTALDDSFKILCIDSKNTATTLLYLFKIESVRVCKLMPSVTPAVKGDIVCPLSTD